MLVCSAGCSGRRPVDVSWAQETGHATGGTRIEAMNGGYGSCYAPSVFYYPLSFYFLLCTSAARGDDRVHFALSREGGRGRVRRDRRRNLAQTGLVRVGCGTLVLYAHLHVQLYVHVEKWALLIVRTTTPRGPPRTLVDSSDSHLVGAWWAQPRWHGVAQRCAARGCDWLLTGRLEDGT